MKPMINNQENVKERLKNYEAALSKHCWKAVDPFFHPDATVIFAEATYYGKHQVSTAISKTFSMIKDEHFKIYNVYWTMIHENFATCTFDHEWSGSLHGQKFANIGRGTITWVKESDTWQIINQHFGPAVK